MYEAFKINKYGGLNAKIAFHFILYTYNPLRVSLTDFVSCTKASGNIKDKNYKQALLGVIVWLR